MFGAKEPKPKQEPRVPAPRPLRDHNNIPPPPHERQITPRTRRLADEAMQVRQEVIDLQEQLDLTETERNDLKVQVGVLERTLLRVEHERDVAQDDARTHRDRVAEIETRFESVAELLIPILERRPKMARNAPTPEPERPRGTFEEEMQKLVAADHEVPRT